MTDAPLSRPSRRVSPRSVVVFFVSAAAAGIGVGVLVDVISPNPTYGLQIEAVGLAILIAVVVGVIPATRRLLPAALGLAAGVIVGVSVGPGPPRLPGLGAGTIEVRLERPELTTGSAAATCYVVDGVLKELFTADGDALRLADGRPFGVSLGPGEEEPVALDRPFDIVVTIRSTLPDGSPTETRMTSDASSTLTISDAGASGSMTFSGLVLPEKSELRVPIDIAGRLEWSCTAS